MSVCSMRINSNLHKSNHVDTVTLCVDSSFQAWVYCFCLLCHCYLGLFYLELLVQTQTETVIERLAVSTHANKLELNGGISMS